MTPGGTSRRAQASSFGSISRTLSAGGMPQLALGLSCAPRSSQPRYPSPEIRWVTAAPDQLNASASKLEHSSTRLAAVSARNPSDTKS
jgi:hypothetical protein